MLLALPSVSGTAENRNVVNCHKMGLERKENIFVSIVKSIYLTAVGLKSWLDMKSALISHRLFKREWRDGS
jgi:hypothetical protein